LGNNEEIITIRIKDLLKTRKERKHYKQFFRILNELSKREDEE